jgi:hypothetical protein
MENSRQVIRHELSPRQLLLVDRPDGQLFGCETGELWITQDRSRRDVILRPGQSWRAPHGQTVVISAFQPSVLTVTGPAASTVARTCRRLAEPLLTRIRRWRFPALASFPAHLIR